MAEACSNLAILYNQKGEYDKALPLYERALKIYEKHFGKDHPEVAHTLTDLAVLHLEQVRGTTAWLPGFGGCSTACWCRWESRRKRNVFACGMREMA